LESLLHPATPSIPEDLKLVVVPFFFTLGM
jgi:hypothetical protein